MGVSADLNESPSASSKISLECQKVLLHVRNTSEIIINYSQQSALAVLLTIWKIYCIYVLSFNGMKSTNGGILKNSDFFIFLLFQFIFHDNYHCWFVHGINQSQMTLLKCTFSNTNVSPEMLWISILVRHWRM